MVNQIFADVGVDKVEDGDFKLQPDDTVEVAQGVW